MSSLAGMPVCSEIALAPDLELTLPLCWAERGEEDRWVRGAGMRASSSSSPVACRKDTVRRVVSCWGQERHGQTLQKGL